MRVSQLDSHLLDQELLALLEGNINSALSLYRSNDLASTVGKTFLRAIVWKIGIWDHGNTYGSKLQSLRYFNLTRSKKIILGLFSVLGPLIQEKVGGELQGPLRKFVAQAEAAYEVLALANFVSYIAGARYDSVLHRILKVQLRPISSAYRAVSFEFLNRQLIWSQFTEFLLVFLPLLNLPRLKRKLTAYFPKPDSQRLDFLPRRICAICYNEGSDSADIVNPYQADCGHIYCYGCVMSQIKLAEGEGWPCLRCGEIVLGAKPWVEKVEDDDDSARRLVKVLKNVHTSSVDDPSDLNSEGNRTDDEDRESSDDDTDDDTSNTDDLIETTTDDDQDPRTRS